MSDKKDEGPGGDIEKPLADVKKKVDGESKEFEESAQAELTRIKGFV